MLHFTALNRLINKIDQNGVQVLCVSQYAEDIYQHLRDSEVRNYLNFEHQIPFFI